jgi:hypothetical protein
MCQSLERAIAELEKYLGYVNRNSFESNHATTWLNRTTTVTAAVEDFLNTIEQFTDPNYERAADTMSRYIKFMNKVVNSLAKDGDLDFGLGSSDSEVRDTIIRNSTVLLQYLRDFKGAIRRCDNPDSGAGNAVPPPTIDPGPPEDPGTGGGTAVCPSNLAFCNVNHTNIVEEVKLELINAGVNITGSCGAFEITSRVAWRLAGEGAGLLDKPSGNNCQGYAVDIIAYPGTHHFDILGDAGGANTPQWDYVGLVDANRWRAPFDPGP